MGIFSATPKASFPGDPGRRPESTSLSIVAAGATIVGDVATGGVVKVEGEIEGTVRAGSQVLIAKGGTVRGDIFAREAIIGGQVHGTIRATERVEVQAGALVLGDIMTQRILIAEGGAVNGQITMESEPAPANGNGPGMSPESLAPARISSSSGAS